LRDFGCATRLPSSIKKFAKYQRSLYCARLPTNLASLGFYNGHKSQLGPDAPPDAIPTASFLRVSDEQPPEEKESTPPDGYETDSSVESFFGRSSWKGTHRDDLNNAALVQTDQNDSDFLDLLSHVVDLAKEGRVKHSTSNRLWTQQIRQSCLLYAVFGSFIENQLSPICGGKHFEYEAKFVGLLQNNLTLHNAFPFCPAIFLVQDCITAMEHCLIYLLYTVFGKMRFVPPALKKRFTTSFIEQPLAFIQLGKNEEVHICSPMVLFSYIPPALKPVRFLETIGDYLKDLHVVNTESLPEEQRIPDPRVIGTLQTFFSTNFDPASTISKFLDLRSNISLYYTSRETRRSKYLADRSYWFPPFEAKLTAAVQEHFKVDLQTLMRMWQDCGAIHAAISGSILLATIMGSEPYATFNLRKKSVKDLVRMKSELNCLPLDPTLKTRLLKDLITEHETTIIRFKDQMVVDTLGQTSTEMDVYLRVTDDMLVATTQNVEDRLSSSGYFLKKTTTYSPYDEPENYQANESIVLTQDYALKNQTDSPTMQIIYLKRGYQDHTPTSTIDRTIENFDLTALMNRFDFRGLHISHPAHIAEKVMYCRSPRVLQIARETTNYRRRLLDSQDKADAFIAILRDNMIKRIVKYIYRGFKVMCRTSLMSNQLRNHVTNQLQIVAEIRNRRKLERVKNGEPR
jgi:hypothetical protein